MHTFSAKTVVKLALPSFSSLFPADEKSWQGGPPIIILGSPSNNSSSVKVFTSLLIMGCLKFFHKP